MRCYNYISNSLKYADINYVLVFIIINLGIIKQVQMLQAWVRKQEREEYNGIRTLRGYSGINVHKLMEWA